MDESEFPSDVIQARYELAHYLASLPFGLPSARSLARQPAHHRFGSVRLLSRRSVRGNYSRTNGQMDFHFHVDHSCLRRCCASISQVVSVSSAMLSQSMTWPIRVTSRGVQLPLSSPPNAAPYLLRNRSDLLLLLSSPTLTKSTAAPGRISHSVHALRLIYFLLHATDAG